MGNGAFEDCYGLQLIVFLCRGTFSCPEGNNIFKNAGINVPTGCELRCGLFTEKIPDNLFCPNSGKDFPNLHKITFERSTIEGNEEIVSRCKIVGQKAFSGCEDLMSLELPKTLPLENISVSAFEKCVRLVEILGDFDKSKEELLNVFPRAMIVNKKTNGIIPTTSIETVDEVIYDI